jgi:hypothetical protein
LFIILGGAALRFVPHWPNFTPVAAIALFGGGALASRPVLAVLIPLLIMFLSDIFIGFHPTMPFVYISLILTTFLGRMTQLQPARIFAGSIISSLLFFLITNYGVWLVNSGNFYTRDFSGLMACYAAALPFFDNTSQYGISFFFNSLLGDMFFNGLFFMVFIIFFRPIPRTEKSEVSSWNH